MTNYFKKPDRLVDAVRAVLSGKGNEYAQKLLDKEDSIDETNKNDDSDDGEGLDAVQPKAVKKKFKDRKDKDIDNDGDTDDSDKFIHKKRKAISKKIKDDDIEEAHDDESDESDDENGEDKKKKKKAKKTNGDGKKDEVDTEPEFDDQKQLPAEQKEENELTEMEGQPAKKDKDGKYIKKAGYKIQLVPRKGYVYKRDTGKPVTVGGLGASGRDHGPGLTSTREEVELEERKMSDDEMKKKEDIVMGMKKKMSDFKKKYGDRAKDVMYATATKMAMKEGFEISAEDFDGVQKMAPVKGKVKSAREVGRHGALKKPKTMLVVKKGTQTVSRVPVDKGKEMMRKGTHLEAESVEHDVKSIDEDRMAGKYKKGQTIVIGQWSESWAKEYILPNVDEKGVKIYSKGPAFRIEKL